MLFRSLLCQISKLDSQMLRTGQLNNDKDWNELTKACDKLYQSPIFIDDTPLDERQACGLDPESLARRFPEVAVDRDAIFVQQQNIWTSAGVTAGIDLALAMVEEDLGRNMALEVAQQLVVFLKRPGGQSQFSVSLAAQATQHSAVQAAQQWVLEHLDQPMPLALLAGKHEVAAVFAREQEFSRFASHELRTPNMVIQGSAALLGKVTDLPAPAARAASRIRAASDEMALLTETFLLLGRKEAVERPPQWVAPLIERELTRLAPLLQRENLDIRLNLDEQSEVQAPLSLLAIALGNLLKNALSYAEGHIEIALQGQVLTISNPTAAAPDQILGYGCGLTIIQRICEKLGWQIETRLEDGVFSARLAMNAPDLTQA